MVARDITLIGLWLTNWSNIGPKIMVASIPWIHKSLSETILLASSF
jgi:hypothetical protein